MNGASGIWARSSAGRLPDGAGEGARLLYHVAPRHCRASIAQHGLDSSCDTLPGLPGTYLWETPEQACAYAGPLGDDVWIVECTGIPLEFGGPWSVHPGERWTPDPIGSGRLRGRLGELLLPTFPRAA